MKGKTKEVEEMIKVSVFCGKRPEEGKPKEVKILTVFEALYLELLQRLSWSTRIDELSSERIILECPDTEPKEFVVFESKDPSWNPLDDELASLDRVAEWYAMATGQYNKQVARQIEGELKEVVIPDYLDRLF